MATPTGSIWLDSEVRRGPFAWSCRSFSFLNCPRRHRFLLCCLDGSYRLLGGRGLAAESASLFLPVCVPKTWSVLIWRKNCLTSATMIALLSFLLTLLLASPFRSKSRLEAESAALRHQLTVLRRKVRGGVLLITTMACS